MVKKNTRYKAKPTCVCLKCRGPAASFGSLVERDFFFEVVQPLIQSGAARESKKHKLIHPAFKLPGGVTVYADFAFEEWRPRNTPIGDHPGGSWELRVIDVKPKNGHLTKTFKKNQRLIRGFHGVEIEAVPYSRGR
jgi:hypothetical protein